MTANFPLCMNAFCRIFILGPFRWNAGLVWVSVLDGASLGWLSRTVPPEAHKDAWRQCPYCCAGSTGTSETEREYRALPNVNANTQTIEEETSIVQIDAHSAFRMRV